MHHSIAQSLPLQSSIHIMSSNKATPTDCSIEFDTHLIRGKTAIVTGGNYENAFTRARLTDSTIGAQGIGEAYVRALANAGYEHSFFRSGL